VRGYADQATFEVSPCEGEVRVISGVACTYVTNEYGSAYVGTDDNRDVIATRRWDGSWSVAVTTRSTVRRVVADLAVAS
jgi:hypothetical protein